MGYMISLYYKDDKSLNVKIKDEEMGQFFDDLTAGQIYRHPDSKTGFWTNLADIRYIMVNPNEEPSIEVVKKADQPDSDEVSSGDEPDSEQAQGS